MHISQQCFFVEIMTYMVKQNDKKYIAPEVKFVEVVVEEGFLISGIIINERYQQGGEYLEKHIVDDVETW